MSKLSGVLGDYVTVAMAVGLLGYRKEQTGRFYTLVKKGLPTYKIGGMTLAKLAELIELAGLPASTSTPWPAVLASLQMESLHSRNDAASILGVSPRTVNRYAKIGKISALDLSTWGGYTLYIYPLDDAILAQVYTSIGDWKVQLEIDIRDKLLVTIAGKGGSDGDAMVASTGICLPSRMAFFSVDEYSPPSVIVKVEEKLS